MKESEIQTQILKYLKSVNIMCLRMHTQGVRQKGGRAKNTNKGMADLLILHDNKIIWVEVKTSTGKQSVEQIQFQKDVMAEGFPYIVVCSLEQLLEQLEVILFDDSEVRHARVC